MCCWRLLRQHSASSVKLSGTVEADLDLQGFIKRFDKSKLSFAAADPEPHATSTHDQEVRSLRALLNAKAAECQTAKEENAKLAEVIARLEDDYVRLLADMDEMRKECKPWSYEKMLQISDSDCRSLTGFSHDALVAYKEWVELFEPKNSIFKGLHMCWEDILVLMQIKIRNNPTYVMLEMVFKSDKSNLSRYVVDMLIYLFRISSICMQYDIREEADKRRIHGFEGEFNGIDFAAVEHVLGMTKLDC